MLRLAVGVSLLLVGTGASAAEREALRLEQNRVSMTYAATADCIETVVSVWIEEQVVHGIGAHRRSRWAAVQVRIRDTCAGADLLVADHTTSAPLFELHDTAWAAFHDDFLSESDSQVAIDVTWRAEELTEGGIVRRSILRDRVQSPDEITSLTSRQRANAADVAGTLVIDGISTDLSGATGLLLTSTRTVSILVR